MIEPDYRTLGRFTGEPATTPRSVIASLIGRCEVIIGRGFLPEDQEARLRIAVNETCRAFDMAPLSEGLKAVLERSK